jgi:hypothetical protein
LDTVTDFTKGRIKIMKKWKSILTMVLALVVAFSVPAMASDVTLKATQTSENSVAIEMENDVPILGVEFILNWK